MEIYFGNVRISFACILDYAKHPEGRIGVHLLKELEVFIFTCALL